MQEQESLQPLPTSQVLHLRRAAEKFQKSLGEKGRAYLDQRGILETAVGNGLGEVKTDDPEWVRYNGMISIPYYNGSGDVVSLRFRAMGEDAKPKYLQPPGSDILPYNLPAILKDTETIVLCEGEIDCLTLVSLGINAIGLPGANSWRTPYRRLLEGFPRIIVWGDPDDAGRAFNESITKSIRRAVPAYMGTDINQALVDGDVMEIFSAFERAGGRL